MTGSPVNETERSLPSVSVVMATYNRAHRLRDVIAPLQADRATSEIVVVVDGSEDGSFELLQELAASDARIKPILVPNGGASRAQQAGLEAATSEVVLIVDDDVCASPGLVTGHARHHADTTGLVVAGYMPTAAPREREPGNFPSFLYHDQYEAHCAEWERNPESVLSSLWGGNVSVRRKDLLAAGGMLPEIRLHYHYDYELGLRFQRIGLTGIFDRSLHALHLHERKVDRFLSEAEGSGKDQAAIRRLHPQVQAQAYLDDGLPRVLRAFASVAARDPLHRIAKPALRSLLDYVGRLRIFSLEVRLGFALKLVEFQHGVIEETSSQR